MRGYVDGYMFSSRRSLSQACTMRDDHGCRLRQVYDYRQAQPGCDLSTPPSANTAKWLAAVHSLWNNSKIRWTPRAYQPLLRPQLAGRPRSSTPLLSHWSLTHCLFAVCRHVRVINDSALRNAHLATRQVTSSICCGIRVTGLRAHGVLFLTKAGRCP